MERVRRAQRMGARGFGEHKVPLAVDAPESLAIYRLCADFGWPVLLHFEYGRYNPNFEAFEAVLDANQIPEWIPPRVDHDSAIVACRRGWPGGEALCYIR